MELKISAAKCKLITALAVICALCLNLSIIFAIPGISFAAVENESAGTVNFNAAEDFVIEGGVLNGLSDEASELASSYSKVVLDIPADSGITGIGVNAFSGLTNIVSLSIPEGVTSIASGAFASGEAIENITLPSTVTAVAMDAFGSGDSIVSVEVPDLKTWLGIEFTGDRAYNPLTAGKTSIVAGGQTVAGEITVPADITKINAYAFYDYEGITSVSVHENVTEIGAYAFWYNETLKEVKFTADASGVKSNLEMIGAYAFENTSLQEFAVPASMPEGGIGDYAFNGCERLVVVYNLNTSLNITLGEATYGGIAENALVVVNTYNGTSLLVKTGDYVFLDSENPYLYTYTGNAADLTLPVSHKGKSYGICDNAFKNCTSLRTLRIETGSVNDIGDYAFAGCTSLRSAYIGAGAGKLGAGAFAGCSSLQSVTVLSGLQEIGANAFNGCSELSEIDLQNSAVEVIGGSAFEGCGKLTIINIPASVTTIGNRAYYGCESAVILNMGANVQTIGYAAFAYTSSLKEAEIPDSVVSLGIGTDGEYEGALTFLGSGITSVTVGSGVTSLSYAFADCANLTDVKISKDAQINEFDGAFAGCSSLTTLEVPDTVTSMTRLFGYAWNLTSLYLPDTLGGLLTSGDDTAFTLFDVREDAEQLIKPFSENLSVYFPAITDENRGNYGRCASDLILAIDKLAVTRYGETADIENPVETMLSRMLFVFPDEETYGLVLGEFDTAYADSYLSEEINAAASEFYTADYIKSKIYYLEKVTYEVCKVKTDGSTETLVSEDVEKLASYDGADFRYSLITDDYGSRYFAFDNAFKLPEKVGVYGATGEWKIGSADGEAADVSAIKVNGPITLVNVLGTDSKLEINIPDSYEGNYTASAWIPEWDANLYEIYSVNGSTAVTQITDAGTYTVTVRIKAEYAADYMFANGTDRINVTVVINPVAATVVWEWRGSEVGADSIPSKAYDGTGITGELTVSFIGIDGKTVTIPGSDLLRYKDGVLTESAAPVGLWTLEIPAEVLAGKYSNYILSHTSQQFRIENAGLDVTNDVLNKITFGLEDGTQLASGLVYIHLDGSNKIPALAPLSGYTLSEVINVENLIARYKNSNLTLNLIISSGSVGMFEADASATTGAVRREVGIHETKFVLKASANYEFTMMSGINGSAQGLNASVSADGKTLTITKTWYIVQLTNEFLMPNATSDNDEYSIAGWTYGDSVSSVPAPRLMHGDENTGWETSDLVSFVLSYGSNSVTFTRDKFAEYINGAMPAGVYTLTASVVRPFELEAHKHWWNNGSSAAASYPVFSRDYQFEVIPADITLNLSKGDKGYADYSWEITSGSKIGFFNGFTEALKDKLVLKTAVGDAGYWADRTSNVGAEITYNFARMYNDSYLASNITDLINHIEAGTNATYTVYFKITAPNHKTLGGAGNSKFDYFFTVTVYETIDAANEISIGNVVYTGGRVVPVIPTDTRYKVQWDLSDTYVEGGVHNVSFTLNDSVHYRWKSEGANLSNGGATVTLTFEITPANNDKWSSAPGIIAWEFGNFNANNNLIIAVPQFLDENKLVQFAIAYDREGENLVEGLESFTAPGGVVQSDGNFRSLLNMLPTTEETEPYYLIVTVEETNNYYGNSAAVPFVIRKGTNTWNVTPNVMQWRYGAYDENINLVLAEPKIKDADNPVKFKVTADKDGKTILISEFTLENGIVPSRVAKEFKENFKVGTYYLWASVGATEMYSALEPAPFEFSVTKANNYWDDAFNIAAWIEGRYDEETNKLTANSHFGEAVIKIADANDENSVFFEGANGTEEFANALRGLKAGRYLLTAVVGDDGNVETFNDYIIFSVFERPGLPWWAVLIIVVGCLGIAAAVLYILHQKGVLQMLTGKVVIAMRTKATVDATIAAVRANKVAAMAKITVAEAEARDREEAERKAAEENGTAEVKSETEESGNETPEDK